MNTVNKKQDLISTLKSRNLLKQCSDNTLPEKLCLYVGFDATSSSLHIGSLIPLRMLKIARELGHKTIGLLGSGTTLLGDPTWKSKTRPIIDKDAILRNATSICKQIEKIADPEFMVDNVDWFSSMNILTFMRDVAARFSVNELLSMETFDNRISSQSHLSFMEFSYPLLQAYDFAYLNKEYGCNVQIGGSDQWGNITQGIGYVAKANGTQVYGMTSSLLVNASGEKMGKSVDGAIFLDESLKSPYDFWQFWRNVDDSDVANFMLQLTDLDVEYIKEITSKDIILSKKILADEVTKFVHGEEKAKAAREQSESIFEQNSHALIPSIEWTFGESIKLEKLVVQCGFTNSLSEAKRLINSGAIQVDGEKILDHSKILSKHTYIVCYGKKKYIKVIS
jgi:tyrosyl-tRNA synthetase